MIRFRYLVGAVALSMAVVLASADVHAQRPRSGAGGGFGGFGGGGFGGDPVVSLLRIEEVLVEIEAQDDQKEQINKILEQSRGERPQVNFRELSQAEREKAFAEMRERAAKQSAEARAKIDEVLLPHQVKRVKEISLQVRGTQALTDDEVASDLKLTEKQQEQIATKQRENSESLREKMREAFQGGDREGIREKLQQLRADADKEVLAVLTADQQKQFESMKGEAFKMPERTFGGRRPGQGPQGTGERRGNDRPASDN